jgi:hypothetical protein
MGEISQNRLLVGKITLLISLVGAIAFIALLFAEQPGSGVRVAGYMKWVVLGIALTARVVSALAVPRRR